MSAPRTPDPGMLFLSLLSSSWEGLRERLLPRLGERFGPVTACSLTMPFDKTAYYDAELGAPIFRRVLCFEELQPLDALPRLKHFTNALEQELAQSDGRRVFNLDPGLLTLERLVLATGKNFTHRIYLGDGIWGDLTLIYTRGSWQSLPWTFPDYADAPMRELLTALRALYRQRLGRTQKQETTIP